MNFNEQQLRIIHQAVRYYQVHGIHFNGEEHRICDEILNITFDNYYTQIKEQST